MLFKISVIIPVYNCERFIEKAIISVLAQSEVYEIVVVNDGSTDGTNTILESLQSKNDRMKVCYHPKEVNLGRSASRNLGIKNSSCSYIAFLDADDYYLPNRFKNDKKIFLDNSYCDGVYNAVGFHFYRDTEDSEAQHFKLNTLTQIVHSDNLFEALISGKFGYIHLNGLTVKKSVFNDIGFFNEELIVAEDSDLIFKMALICQLQPSIINAPLAKRGIHYNNVFNRDDLYQIFNIKMYESVFIWSGNNKIPLRKVDVLLKWIWIFIYKEKKTMLYYIKHWFYLFSKTPKWFFTKLSVKYFPIVRLRQKLFPFLFK
ncbi:MAG: glycosyltransferase family 2 protein [Flaviramulus sp.]|nr:glycosyltransferase family 2 protein [Flaviramulus sp.]NNC50943.1 glycosyltransferase family 2 protein [Flaviramulus sp.]